jgi:hypothetical protein
MLRSIEAAHVESLRAEVLTRRAFAPDDRTTIGTR